ncbi:MBOAT-domain-containing protein [Xylona heveae TC161]|uniref:MBOAT-domain-containing protein n=1 Tax=Xylona heveae (strain CBS 132557 / TC161) TaxID=1328760 RepID=A0A165A9D4_XYLHT|nr:MBOAT-domain-containing protein [Xylona heveae TC161]KZF20125.1 MBOAT-domain-containing protein [Xylona heveae TC161]
MAVGSSPTMAETSASEPADLRGNRDVDAPASVSNAFFKRTSSPSASRPSSPKSTLSDSEIDQVALPIEISRLREQQSGSSSSPSTPSIEDYDTQSIDYAGLVAGGRGGGVGNKLEGLTTRQPSWPLGARPKDEILKRGQEPIPQDFSNIPERAHQRRRSVQVTFEQRKEGGGYILTADDPELREILRHGLEREAKSAEALAKGKKRPIFRFRDLVFTKQFTAFDRQNQISADSPFHGFFTLFWLGTALLILKIAAQNWKIYGNILGNNEILKIMMERDVVVLGLTDGIMCAATAFCWLLQVAVFRNYVSWNKTGWIIQNIWQTLYLAGVIGWSSFRDWPWTHTVFIVMHCLAMLMKQHSYAFYNGYLSEVYKRKAFLERKLKLLRDITPSGNPSIKPDARASSISVSPARAEREYNLQQRRRSLQSRSASDLRGEHTQVGHAASAIEPGASLDAEQIQTFERIINWELDELSEELTGKCSQGAKCYPHNLTLGNLMEYIALPTLVYELEYPRQSSISWLYVAEKTAATFGTLLIMLVVSQAYIYPVVVQTVHLKEQGIPLQQRLMEFPWVLMDMLFPFMLEYLLTWYVIWECILNVLAELTRFADRGFYGDWWNSVSWDQFARDWNRPVHNFLLRHVYHSSISALKLSRSSATLVTFLLSACVHELVMWCIFKKLRGYLLGMQMLQLPLVMLSRTRFLKGKTILGNVIFWLGIFTGPSFLCTLYLIL